MNSFTVWPSVPGSSHWTSCFKAHPHCSECHCFTPFSEWTTFCYSFICRWTRGLFLLWEFMIINSAWNSPVQVFCVDFFHYSFLSFSVSLPLSLSLYTSLSPPQSLMFLFVPFVLALGINDNVILYLHSIIRVIVFPNEQWSNSIIPWSLSSILFIVISEHSG